MVRTSTLTAAVVLVSAMSVEVVSAGALCEALAALETRQNDEADGTAVPVDFLSAWCLSDALQVSEITLGSYSR